MRALTIHGTQHEDADTSEGRERGDKDKKHKGKMPRPKGNRSSIPLLLLPCLHPPVHLRVAPTKNSGQENVTRCLYRIARLAMCIVCVFSKEPVALGGALGVWAPVLQRRFWEVFCLHMSFDLFVGRARP